MDIKAKRAKRRKQTAEVFTPPKLVNEMLSKLPNKVWRKNKTFLDPACGDGNFLICILWKKLSKGHDPIEALKTVYGLDIMKDNIAECRIRLLKVISLFEEVSKEHVKIILTNVRWLSKKWANGSLGYDMSFKANYNQAGVDRCYDIYMAAEEVLLDMPVKDRDVPEKLIDMFGVE